MDGLEHRTRPLGVHDGGLGPRGQRADIGPVGRRHRDADRRPDREHDAIDVDGCHETTGNRGGDALGPGDVGFRQQDDEVGRDQAGDRVLARGVGDEPLPDPTKKATGDLPAEDIRDLAEPVQPDQQEPEARRTGRRRLGGEQAVHRHRESPHILQLGHRVAVEVALLRPQHARDLAEQGERDGEQGHSPPGRRRDEHRGEHQHGPGRA